ncbi:MAG: TonB-dependent receptor, partial [Acidobacteriota bacterium]
SGEHIRNKQRRNDWGFTFGGPIVIPKVYDGHNKSFFFFNLEQFREKQNIGTGVATVPTLAYRAGDFTSAGCTDYDTANLVCRARPPVTLGGAPAFDTAGNAIINGGIYDPTSYRVVNGFPTRTLYPNQRVPLTSFDRVATNIQSQFPLPTNNNLTNNYNIPAYTNYRHNTIPSIKIDHNLSSTMRISGYWGQTITNQPNANGFDAEKYPWTGAQFNSYHNNTVRINFDDTLTPTLILHVGIGYFHQREPNPSNAYDQTKIGLPGPGSVNAFPYANAYPTIGGLSNATAGGFGPGIGAGFDATAWEQKPTANLNLTWVKGNHTYKFGGDLTLEGYITKNRWRANGNFSFAAAQTGNPWENGQATNLGNPTGFSYASFLLGQPNFMQLAQQTFTREGSKALSFYAQDNWKVTRKLTVEYGLRYDFQTYLREQHGRHASAAFNTLNPTVGLNGAIVYEATCKCRQSSNYPFAFGPRANLSYQIKDKTVFRAGFGVNYNVVQTTAGNNFSVGDFYSINAPGYGISPLPLGLQGGNTFYKGNPYGNTEVIWPVFDPGRLPTRNAGLLPPESPFSVYHPGSRPGRIMQWSIGLQHEVIRNLVIEASYVGNRGAWFYSPLLDTMSMNTLGDGQLARYGLDIGNANDRTLLSQTIGSVQAAQRGFFAPYNGFPSTQQVGQAIRPVPQWTNVNPYLGPNRANSWYDSLQFQATKRYSNNLDLTANITYS